MDSNSPFRVTATKAVYENPWIKVREDEILRRGGVAGVYTYMEVRESVVVVAVDNQRRICLVETYRHPFGDWFWELPGGGGEGEDLLTASKQELEEEAGVTADNWSVLGRARVCNGLSTEWQTNVLVTNVSYQEFMSREDETRNRKFVSIGEIDEMIRSGELSDNQSISALYMYKQWLEHSDNE